MRLRLTAPPNKGLGLGTIWVAGTIQAAGFIERAGATILFLTALGATLGIGFKDPRLECVYECVVFSLAAGFCWKGLRLPAVPGLPLAMIACWGFFQLVMGATVYRYATLTSSLRFAALAATAWIGFGFLRSHGLRVDFLRAIAWLGALLAALSVLAYFTSPGKIFWVFDAPYPDIWGPFLSRNNFAQFLELTMPVALWFALEDQPGGVLYLSFAAIMLASGLASASRAGAAILVAETIALFWMRRKSPRARQAGLSLVVATILCAAIPGTGHLAGRLTSPDPFEDRREIAHSTLDMIASRPWKGFGLGTFSTVYPGYAMFDVGKSVDHAHNDWLEWTAEGGIFFAIAWIVLALWSVRPALRTGWGIGVLGCFLHAAVDYPFPRFGVAGWAFILLGMLAASDLREVRHRVH